MRASLLVVLMLLSSPARADKLVNWEMGFEVDVPTTWLRQDGGVRGLKLASEDVRLSVEPYFGVTQATQIERLHQQSKAAGYEFKNEKSYPIHEVPAHQMIFYKNGQYLIYYVLISGSRGFLLTVNSEGTDSPSFHQAQDIISDFRVMPLR